MMESGEGRKTEGGLMDTLVWPSHGSGVRPIGLTTKVVTSYMATHWDVHHQGSPALSARCVQLEGD